MKKKLLYISFLSIILTSLTVFTISIFKPNRIVDEPNKIKTNPNISIPLPLGKKPGDFSAIDNLLIALGVFEGQNSYQSNGFGEVTATGATQTLHDQTYYNDHNLIVSNISIGTFSKIIEQHYQNLKKDAFLIRNGKMPSGKSNADDAIWSVKQPRKFTKSEYNDAYGIKYQSFTPFILNKSTIVSASQEIIGDKVIISALLAPEAANLYKRVIWTQGKLAEPPVYSRIKLKVEIDNEWIVSKTTTNTNYQVQVGIIKSNCTSELVTTFTYNDEVSKYFTDYYLNYVKNLKDIIKNNDDTDTIDPGDVLTKIFSNNLNLKISGQNNVGTICYMSYTPIINNAGELQHIEIVLEFKLLDVQIKVVVDQKEINNSKILIKKNKSSVCEVINFDEFSNINSDIINLIKLAINISDSKSFLSNFIVSKTLDKIYFKNSVKGFVFEFVTDLNYKLEKISFDNELFTEPFNRIEVIPVVYKSVFTENNLTYVTEFSDALKTFLITKKFHLQNLIYKVNDDLCFIADDLAIDLASNMALVNLTLKYKNQRYKFKLVKDQDNFYLSFGPNVRIKTKAATILELIKDFLSEKDAANIQKLLQFKFDFTTLLSSNFKVSSKLDLIAITSFINQNFINGLEKINLVNLVNDDLFIIDKSSYNDGKLLFSFVRNIVKDYLNFKNDQIIKKSLDFTFNLNGETNNTVNGIITFIYDKSFTILLNINKINNTNIDCNVQINKDFIMCSLGTITIKDTVNNFKNLLNIIKQNDSILTMLPPEFAGIITLMENNSLQLSNLVTNLTILSSENNVKLIFDKVLPLLLTLDLNFVNEEFVSLALNYGKYNALFSLTDIFIVAPIPSGKIISLDVFTKILETNTLLIDYLQIEQNDLKVKFNNLLLDINQKYISSNVTITNNKFNVSFGVTVDSLHIYLKYNNDLYKIKTEDILSKFYKLNPDHLDVRALFSFNPNVILDFVLSNIDWLASKLKLSKNKIKFGHLTNPESTIFDSANYKDCNEVASKLLEFVFYFVNNPNTRVFNYHGTFNLNNKARLEANLKLDLTNKCELFVQVYRFNNIDVNLYFKTDFTNHLVIFNNTKCSFTNNTIQLILDLVRNNNFFDNINLEKIIKNLDSFSQLININKVIKTVDLAEPKLRADMDIFGMGNVSLSAVVTDNYLQELDLTYGENFVKLVKSNNNITAPNFTKQVDIHEFFKDFISKKQIGFTNLVIKKNKTTINITNCFVDFNTNFLTADVLVKYAKTLTRAKIIVKNNNLYFKLNDNASFYMRLESFASYLKEFSLNIDNYLWLFSFNIKKYFNYLLINSDALLNNVHNNFGYNLIKDINLVIPAEKIICDNTDNYGELVISKNTLQEIKKIITNKTCTINFSGTLNKKLNENNVIIDYDLIIEAKNELVITGEIKLFFNNLELSFLVQFDKEGLVINYHGQKIKLTTSQIILILEQTNFLGLENDEATNFIKQVFATSLNTNKLLKLLTSKELNTNNVITNLNVNQTLLSLTFKDKLHFAVNLNDTTVMINYVDLNALTSIKFTQDKLDLITDSSLMDEEFILLLLNIINKLKPEKDTKQLVFDNVSFNVDETRINCKVSLDFLNGIYEIKGNLVNSKIITDFSVLASNDKFYITLFNKLKIVVAKTDILDILNILNNNINNENIQKIRSFINSDGSIKLDQVLFFIFNSLVTNNDYYKLIYSTLNNLASSTILFTTDIELVDTDSFSQISDLLPIVSKLLKVYQNGDFLSLLDGNYRFAGKVKHEKNPEGAIVDGGYLLFDFDFTTAILYQNSRYYFGANGYINDYTRKNKRHEIAVYLNDNNIYFQFDLFKTVIRIDQVHNVCNALIKELGIDHPLVNYIKDIDLSMLNTNIKDLISSFSTSQINLNTLFTIFINQELFFKTVINKSLIGGNQANDFGFDLSFTSTNYIEKITVTNFYTRSGETISFDYASLDTNNQLAILTNALKPSFISYDEVDKLIISFIKFYTKKNYHIVGNDPNDSFTIYVLGMVSITYTNLNIKLKFEPVINSNGRETYELHGYVSYKLHSPFTSGTATQDYFNEVELFIKGSKIVMKRSYYKTLIWGTKRYEEKVYDNFNESGEALANNLCDILCLGPSVRKNLVKELKNEPVYNQYDRKEIPPFDAFFKNYSYDKANNTYKTTLELARIAQNNKLSDMTLVVKMDQNNLPLSLLISTKISSIVTLTNTGFKIISYHTEVPFLKICCNCKIIDFII